MRTIKAFTSGIVVGVLISTAGIAAAAIGYKGWQAFSNDFKSGYIAGYLMMSKLARNQDPGGWVDQHYAYVPKASTADWVNAVNEAYSKPEYQQYNIESVLQVAARELAEKYGGGISGEQRQLAALRERLEAIRQKQIADLQAKGQPIPPRLTAPITDLRLAAPKTVAKKDRVKRPRKWCRCDGTNPKEARAARRAAREQAAKDAAAKPTDAKPSDAKPSDAKVPPAAAVPQGEGKTSTAPAATSGGAKTPPAAAPKPAPVEKNTAH